MRRLTINIGTLPQDEFHSDLEAALREQLEQHEIESDERQLWFVSLEALANALKTDLETVSRVLLPPRDAIPVFDARPLHGLVGNSCLLRVAMPVPQMVYSDTNGGNYFGTVSTTQFAHSHFYLPEINCTSAAVLVRS